MKLRCYDNKLVCINDVYEGYATYNSKDYNFHEYGRNEDGLEIFNFLFFRSDIKSIKPLKDFSKPYSKIEELIAEDQESIEEAFDSEEEVYINRLIAYLKDNNMYHE